MTAHHREAAKRAVGEAAAALVQDGMRLGLGTGSTTAFAIAALGRRIRKERLRICGVPTSFFAERLAREHGIPLITLEDAEYLDIALDGADEVDPDLNLIKGRGAAHTREKIVAALARRFVVLVDASKMSDRVGTLAPVPVEFLPMAIGPVSRALKRLGAEPELRMGKRKDGPVVTDQGFWVIDARFERIEDPANLARAIGNICGVLEHGLFIQMAHDVLVGNGEGQVRHLRRG